MNKGVLYIVSIFLILAFSSTVYAKSYSMVFWYPGEAGSTGEAQPVIAEFLDYINKNLKDDEISGKYFNTTSNGLMHIKNSRPQFGIISWIALEENKGTLPQYNIITQTLPLPHGTASDRFTIVGYALREGGEWTPPDNLTIYTSIPFSLNFLKSRVLPTAKNSTTIQSTKTMLMTLKKISSDGDSTKVALLTPMEKYTLDNLKGDWKNNITTLFESPPIPTAQLVYFGDQPSITDKLLSILKTMANNPDGKEILETLRLKGFQ